MSQLLLKSGADRIKLNVTQFRSPMSASINSVQTRTRMHHFPIRAGQPDIQFTVQFRSIADHHDFRDFVRRHQRGALEDNYATQRASAGAITLLWPERGINNWTGYIVSMPVREARFDYAPRVTFGVALVDSLLSERTFGFSLGSDFFSVVGQEIGKYVPDAEDIEAMLRPPDTPTSLLGTLGGTVGAVLDAGTQALNSIVYTVRPGR